MTTRKSLVTKKWSFRPKNDDEKESRRQKMDFPVQKRRRERVSSPKKEVSRAKVTTRSDLVAKKWSFPGKNSDDIGFQSSHTFFCSKNFNQIAGKIDLLIEWNSIDLKRM
ncbi:hypothetical protein [Caldifermentibacillus hisashii]|uniref:hypothetical protein n=1 Tax=Caldifermentibacillus hisashii TaxID=996558 RepID=UPI00310127FF